MKLKELRPYLRGSYVAKFENFKIDLWNNKLILRFRILHENIEVSHVIFLDDLHIVKRDIPKFLSALNVSDDTEIGNPFECDKTFIKLLKSLRGKTLKLHITDFYGYGGITDFYKVED